jgi:dipeptidase E
LSHILLYSDFKPGISNVVDDQYLDLLNGTRCRIGYIPSASDRTRRYFKKVQDHYKKIGITDVSYFDLGDEFHEDSIKEIFESDAIHLSGGDPFEFLRLIRHRNFAEQLKKYSNSGGLLVGVSAGAMILTRSLMLACDSFAPPKVNKTKKALNLLDFEFYPHFKDDQKTSKALQSYASHEKVFVYACDDVAGVLVRHEQITLLGPVTTFK